MEEDPFAWITAFCKSTASQEVKLRNCLMARQSEYFSDSESDESSPLSPDPKPSRPSEIVMLSPPASLDSVCDRVEDESVFHTPPENHPPPHLSSSEDQNLDEGVEGRNNVRPFESGMGLEREAKKMRVMEEESVFVGETAIVEDTELIVNLGEDDVVKTNGKRIEEIDEFRYDRQRQLPVSLREEVKKKEREKGLLDFMEVLKVIVGNTEDSSEDDEDEDLFVMIQRKGFTFPKPRWW